MAFPLLPDGTNPIHSDESMDVDEVAIHHRETGDQIRASTVFVNEQVVENWQRFATTMTNVGTPRFEDTRTANPADRQACVPARRFDRGSPGAFRLAPGSFDTPLLRPWSHSGSDFTKGCGPTNADGSPLIDHAPRVPGIERIRLVNLYDPHT